MRSVCKGKGHPRTGHEGPEGEQMYNSTRPSTSALDGGGCSAPRPGRFTPGKDPVPFVQEAGWAPGPAWTGVENLAPPPAFDPRTVQSVWGGGVCVCVCLHACVHVFVRARACVISATACNCVS